jgi:hypothetical protein
MPFLLLLQLLLLLLLLLLLSQGLMSLLVILLLLMRNLPPLFAIGMVAVASSISNLGATMVKGLGQQDAQTLAAVGGLGCG